MIKALDAAAISLRSKLGESLSTVQRYSTPLEEATTPSLEALKTYSLGIKTVYAKGDTAALPFYKRAVELDPNFALAYASMSVSYRNLNEGARAKESALRAYELREKVSERERLLIEAYYYQNVTGELEKRADLRCVAADLSQKLLALHKSSIHFQRFGKLRKGIERIPRGAAPRAES